MLKKFTRKIVSFMAAAVMAVTNTVPIAPISAFSEDVSASESETELTMQTIEVSPDEKDSDTLITLEGMMPEGAAAEAMDVSEERDCIAAYDITITAGEEEFQPDEENPIKVEIADPAITDSEGIQLWHITDDGEREQILDFTLEEGKISFYAEGFSVYEIVEMGLPEDIETGWKTANSLSNVASIGGKGFYISNQAGKYYLTGGFIDNVTGDRSGLDAMTSDTAYTTTPPSAASLFFFEAVEGSNNQFYIYIIEKDGEDNEIYKYIQMTTITSGSSTGRGGLKFVEKNSDGTHDGTPFTLEYDSSNNAFFCSYVLYEGENPHYWNRNTKPTGKGAIAAYQSKTDGNIYKLQLHFFKEFSDDPFDLDYTKHKKEYGLMCKTDDEVGYALMANKNFNAKLSEIILDSNTLYVYEDSDITMWKFKNVGEDNYKLYADIDGVTQYLKLQSDNKSFAVTEDIDSAQVFKIEPTSSGTIKLSCTVGSGEDAVTKYLKFNPETTEPAAAAKFDMSGDETTATEMNFVELAAEGHGSKTYTANCISVSDGVNARTGQRVIVYTRIWNNTSKKYDTYAIDHDGSLRKVYAYGDKIMWHDGENVTLFWEFTAYKSGDKENGYYELQNTASKQYLAPQLNGDLLSDETIGIRMSGRRYEYVDGKLYEGEYYSSIAAWDDNYYDYAAIYGEYDDNGKPQLKVGTLGEAGTFYFAVLGDEVYHDEKDRLHEVVTLDNDKFGIKMKMIDFNGTNNSHSTQDTILGDSTSFDSHPNKPEPNILSTQLNDNGYPTTKANKNLSELYTAADLKTVNNLFIKSIYDSSGYFEFDSCQNFATLLGKKDADGNYLHNYDTTTDAEGNTVYNFTVFRELGSHTVNKNTLRHGQFFPYNYITSEVFTDEKQKNLYTVNASTKNDVSDLQGQLLDGDPRKGEDLHKLQGTVNYQFGMELEAKFVQTPSGLDAWGHDIIFEFTGDDDFWLYVDGELVIDLGGIHSALGGTVNFRTGDVVVNNSPTTLKQLFYNNYLKRNRTEAEAEQLLLKDYCTNSETGKIRNLTLEEFKNLYSEEYNAYANALDETAAKNYINTHILYDSELGRIRNITVEEYIKLNYTKEQYDEEVRNSSEAEVLAHIATLCDRPMTADEYKRVYSDDYNDLTTLHTDADAHFSAICNNRQITLDEYKRLYAPTDYDTKYNSYLNSPHTTDEADAYVNSIFELKEGTTDEWVFKDYTEHSMKIFYMERGAGASNLHMRFNLSAVTPGNVLFSKQLSNLPQDANIDLNNVQYPFQIMWKYTNSDEEDWKYLGDTDISGNITVSYQNSTQTVKYEKSFIPASLVGVNNSAGEQITYKNVFFITPGKYLEIKFPDNALYYQIRECAVDKDIYESVTATGSDGGEVTLEETGPLEETGVTGSIKDLLIPQSQVSEQPTIAFNNKLNKDQVKKLHITKMLYNEKGRDPDAATDPTKVSVNALKYDPTQAGADIDNTTFDLRLYLSNGLSSELTATNLQKYYVADADNHICTWDASLKRFVKYKKNGAPIDVSEIKSDDYKYVTFYTSPYGAISNIPAGYSIIVPGLITGTRFRVEERDYEIPTGYELIGYDCVADITNNSNTDGSYELLEQGDNSRGKIKATTDAYMRVNNLRGIGLKADKIWTDEDFTSDHDPIYLAVFCEKSGEPSTYVDGTLRKLTYPDTYVKYFFEKLPDGVTIDDYKIYEVTAENVQVGTDGVLTADPINKIAPGATVTIPAKNKKGETEANAEYTVYYAPGIPTQSSPSVPGSAEGGGNNVREDIIKNVRGGGVEILLNEWSTSKTFDDDVRLEGGKFRLKSVNAATGIASEVGTYTTGKDGVITVIYNFEKDENYDSANKEILYRLEELDPPDGYEGLTKTISFKIKEKDGQTGQFEMINWSNPNDTGNDEDNNLTDEKFWAEYEIPQNSVWVARINIYNKYIPITTQEFYFGIEKNIFVDKNIHDSDSEQKFVFKVERLDENNKALESFFVTMNCKTEQTDLSVAPADNSKYSFDSTEKKVTISYGSGESYVFPTALFHGSQTVKVRNTGKYRVSEVSKWSSTDYDFWEGSNVYIDNTGNNRTAADSGSQMPYVTFMIGDADVNKDSSATVRFTNTESEYAYLSAQAYAENTINRNNS